MKLTADQLARAAGISEEAARLWIAPVNLAGAACNLTTAARWAMWIAQCGHESAGFTRLVESLNYSVDALLSKFGRHRISEADARAFGREGTRPANQREIAARIYGGSWGMENLGNRPGTSDSFSYIGRGLIQITGRDNYAACGKHMGLDLLHDPAMLGNDRRAAAESTAWYWDMRHLNEAADVGDVEGATRLINGGTHGLADRKARYSKAMSALDINVADHLRRIAAR